VAPPAVGTIKAEKSIAESTDARADTVDPLVGLGARHAKEGAQHEGNQGTDAKDAEGIGAFNMPNHAVQSPSAPKLFRLVKTSTSTGP
jgi:hypothetical protein